MNDKKTEYKPLGTTNSKGEGDLLYTIRDRLAEQYGPPFTAVNDAVAVRQYWNIVRNSRLDPNDYELFCVGGFDKYTGKLWCSDNLHVIPVAKPGMMNKPQLPEGDNA